MRIVVCALTDVLRNAFEEEQRARPADNVMITSRTAEDTLRAWAYDAPDAVYSAVSPANCLGFMDGGVDKAYLSVFGIALQEAVQKNIRALAFSSTLGRPFLPIGCAIPTGVKTSDGSRFVLISAPTMCLPQDVSDTRNAYYALRAALRVARRWNETVHPRFSIQQLFVPSMATGYGRMSPLNAAHQMWDALTGVELTKTGEWGGDRETVWWDTSPMCSQPTTRYTDEFWSLFSRDRSAHGSSFAKETAVEIEQNEVGDKK